MEYKKFNFSPEEGFLDSSFYEDTPSNSREILQRQHNQTRDFINEVVDRLNCENEGESGLESIKSPQIEGVFGNNGYEQIKDVKRQLNEVSLNNVPDGSVTDVKLANASVTKDKIKDNEITSEKFSDSCVAPFSNDTKHINGVDASNYAPVSVTGSFDTFKEYVAKTDIYSLSGKTHNNIRYILYNGYMYSLNLLTKEFKKISDIAIDSSYRFFIGNDEKIYLAGYLSESYIGAAGITMYNRYIGIYEYSLEYCELVLKNKIKVTGTTVFDQVSDVDCDGENIYVGLIKSSSPVWHSLYQIKYEEMETLSEVSEMYGFYASQNDYMFCVGGDLIFNNKILKNCMTEEISELEYTVYGYDKDNLLVKDSNVFMIDKNTMEPKIIRTDKTTDTSGFMHDGYFYQIIGGFIVKLRLL